MNETERNDELLAAAKGGDARAAEALLARHEKQIYRFGLRMCGNEEDAKDVLQETLLAAFKGLRDFRAEAALSTWLYQIARSFCTKARRRPVGEPAVKIDVHGPEARGIADADDAGPDANAHAREIGAVLQAAILALPESQREVILLRDVEGLSAEEAAKVVGIDVGALKSRLHRARIDLRAKLASALGETDADFGGGGPCPELADEIEAYASKEIDRSACASIEAHLARCPRCSAACDALKHTVSLCRAAPGGDVPAPVLAAVRKALRAARPA